MDKPNPSTEWTPEERLDVIEWLSDDAYKLSQFSEHSLWEIFQRINRVAYKPAEYLQRNRKSILARGGE